MSRPTRKFKCFLCNYEFEVPYGTGKPQICPRCGAPAQYIHRVGPKGPHRGRMKRARRRFRGGTRK